MSRHSRLCRWSIAGAFLAWGASFSAAGAVDAEPGGVAPRSVILSRLPKPDTDAYRYLRDIAGVKGGESLPMSGSEVWSVDEKRLDMLVHVAQEQGVDMMSVDPTFQLMTPASKNADMDPAARQFAEKMTSDPAVTSATMMRVNPPAMIEFALGRGEKPIIGDHRTKEAESDRIEIPIGPHNSIVAHRLHVETTSEGCVWNGLIEGSNLPVDLMWWPNGRMTGAFTYNRKRYMIRHVTGMEHAVVEIDPDKMPPEHAVERATYRRMSGEEMTNLQDANNAASYLPKELSKYLEAEQAAGSSKPVDTEIAVLFAFTKRAAANYGDIRKDLLALSIEQTNQSFRASKIGNVKVKIADAVEVDYDDSTGNHLNHLWRMVDRGDGYLEDIHRLREKAKADIVLLIVDSPTGCGLATRVAPFADEAFAVVHHGCAATSFSVSHEIGHLIGARHDRALDQSTRPFPFGHGYVYQTAWRTMMSYQNACDGCPRLPIWSSPDVVIDGVKAGDAETNNARVIADQAARVAAFR